jgi:hypothetical protein
MPEETSLLAPYAEIMTKEQIKGFISDWITPAASVIVVIAAILGAVRYFIHNEVADLRGNIQQLTRDVGSLNSGIDKTNGKLDEQTQRLNKRIDDVLTKALERAFPVPNASKQSIRGSLNEMKSVFQLAREEKIALNPRLVETYSRQIAEILNEPFTQLSPVVWNTTQACLAYRSFLNPPVETHGSMPPGRDLTQNSQSGWYLFASRSQIDLEHPGAGFGPFPPTLRTVTNTAWSDNPQGMCVYEPIGLRRNKNITNGPAFLVLNGTGQDLKLDGLEIRHVEFDNLRVIYDGGPVILRDVRFVNCTFEIRKELPGRDLCSELLQAQKVDFKFPIG